MKKLTNEGIEGVDEVVDIDLPPKKQTTQEGVLPQRTNNPNPKNNKITIGKGTYIGLWIFGILMLLLVATHIIWNDIVYTKKDYGSTVNIPDCPECPASTCELNCPNSSDCICNCNLTYIGNST